MWSKMSEDRKWFVLWAPTGFGMTTRILEVENICKNFDSDAQVWYPMFPTVVNGKTRMRPFYSGYAFVRCLWKPRMEMKISEDVPIFTTFLKDIDTNRPVYIVDEKMKMVEEAVSRMLQVPDFLLHGQYEVGMPVRVLKKPFFGLIGKIDRVDAVDAVVVELDMFGRSVPVTVDAHELERLI